MKIYLAGGMTVMNVKGRERQLSIQFNPWRRLFSYHYLKLIHKSEILNIRKNANKQNTTIRRTRNSKTGISK